MHDSIVVRSSRGEAYEGGSNFAENFERDPSDRRGLREGQRRSGLDG